MQVTRIFVLFLVLMAAACGGDDGGGSSVPPPAPEPDMSPGGIWYGTAQSDFSGTTDVVGLVTEAGQGIIIELDTASMYTTSLSVDGAQYSGELRGYAAPGYVFPDGSTLATGSMEGDIEERNRLSGSFTLAGSGGSFDLHYDRDSYEQTASLAIATGTWGYQLSSGYSVSVGINANGQLFGSDSDGCQFNGSISIPDGDYNAYAIQITVSSCPGVNGDYSGLGMILHDPDIDADYILFGLATGQQAFVDYFYRF